MTAVRLNSGRVARLIVAAAGAAALAGLASCADSGGDRPGMTPDRKFYSAVDPGKWAPFAGDHEPECRVVTGEGGGKRIEAKVRFTRRRDPGHYVEAILLLDADRNEVAKKSFNRGERAEALLEVPPGARYPLYVVAKCNRHGMWEKKIEGEGD